MSYPSMIHFSIVFPLTSWSPNRALSSLTKIRYTFITRVALFLHDFVLMNLVRTNNNYRPKPLICVFLNL
jgi:hypothetical protein